VPADAGVSRLLKGFVESFPSTQHGEVVGTASMWPFGGVQSVRAGLHHSARGASCCAGGLPVKPGSQDEVPRAGGLAAVKSSGSNTGPGRATGQRDDGFRAYAFAVNEFVAGGGADGCRCRGHSFNA